MRALPILVSCLAALVGCGSGDSTSFADRFDEDAVAAAGIDLGAAPGEETETPPQTEAQEDAPDSIGLIGGPPVPPRRAFPEDFNQQRTAARAFLQNTDRTATETQQDQGALAGAAAGQVTGTARYEGAYLAEIYKGVGVSNTPTFERAGSDFVLSVDLDTGEAAGASTDGRLVAARAARGAATAGFDGQVTFDGIPGVFGGTLTSSQARADFAGENGPDGYIGSFEANRAD